MSLIFGEVRNYYYICIKQISTIVDAKELNVGQKYLIEWLISNRYIYRNEKGKIKPYSKYSEGDSRLFEVKEYKATNNSHSGTQTLITPRGRETFRLLIPRQQDLDI